MKGNGDPPATRDGEVREAWDRLAGRWELTWQERRMLLPAGGEDDPAPPEDTRRRMLILVEVGHRLTPVPRAERNEWLRMATPAWGWYSPIELMSGSLEELCGFRRAVEAARPR